MTEAFKEKPFPAALDWFAFVNVARHRHVRFVRSRKRVPFFSFLRRIKNRDGCKSLDRFAWRNSRPFSLVRERFASKISIEDHDRMVDGAKARKGNWRTRWNSRVRARSARGFGSCVTFRYTELYEANVTRLRRKMPGVQRTTLLIQKVLARSRGRWTFCSRSPFIAFEARTARWPRFNSVQPLLTERPCRANLATPSIQRADFSRSKYARRAASFGMPSTPRNCLRAVGRKTARFF